MESSHRSIAKAISYRLIASLTTALLTLALTGRLKVAVTVGLSDIVLKLGVYYVHERCWNRLSFGRREEPEYQI